jgi:hypothetical protein
MPTLTQPGDPNRWRRGAWWLSYGGGVNSTALAILLVHGKVPGVEAWEVVFADTGDERPKTYCYLHTFRVWLRNCGKDLAIVRGKETVLERWQRLQVTGSRIIRSCTDEAKVQPIRRHLMEYEAVGQLIGIAADEAHRARPAEPNQIPKRYPLVEQDIDREGCAQIIRDAGLSVPVKSGCWHCPFLRVGEILTLATTAPERFALIEDLELAATMMHPPAPGKKRTQWHDRPAAYWRERALLPMSGELFDDDDDPRPCGCVDG